MPKVLPELTGAKVSPKGTLNVADLKALGWNILKFTAPALAALFGQLALGLTLKQASLFAVYILYALFADYFKKLNDSSK